MAKVTFTLYGKEYTVNCGDGEEERLRATIDFVENKIHDVASRAGQVTEMRLMILTCLLLGDELLESRRLTETRAQEDEELVIAAVNHLKDRVANIASQVGRA